MQKASIYIIDQEFKAVAGSTVLEVQAALASRL